MSNIKQLETVDTRGIALQVQNNRHDAVGTRGFDRVFDSLNTAIGVAGPVATTALGQFGAPKGMAITSAAISSLGNGSTPFYGFGSNPNAMTKGLVAPGTAPGFPGSNSGGGSVGSVGGAGGGMDVFQSQLNSMTENNLTMMTLQQQVQQNAQFWNTASNVEKSKADAIMALVRNIKAA